MISAVLQVLPSAEQRGSRRVRWCSSGRSATSRSRHTRQRPGGSRTTHRQPQTYQRSWRLSAGAARTPSRGELSSKTCKYQIRQATQTARPAQHCRRCPPLGDLTQARPKHQPREYLRCAQCGSDPSACRAVSDHSLMLHMVQKHGGQRLLH